MRADLTILIGEDGQGEPESWWTLLWPQEVLPDLQRAADPVPPERTEAPEDPEQAALEVQRNLWSALVGPAVEARRNPWAAPVGWSAPVGPVVEDEAGGFEDPARPRRRARPSRSAVPFVVDEEEEEEGRRSLLPAGDFLALPAAPAARRPSTREEQLQATARAAELQEELDSQWRDMKTTAAIKAKIAKETKVAEGGDIGSPTPSPPPQRRRGRGGRPRKPRTASPPPRRHRTPPDMDLAGYTPGQKEEEERKRKRPVAVTDVYGNIVGYKSPSTESEEEPPKKKSRRGRGGGRGRGRGRGQ